MKAHPRAASNADRVYMPPDSQREALTDFKKGEIIALRKHLSQRGISRQLEIPRRTIRNFLARYDERENIDDLPKPGRPRKTTTADDHYIVRSALMETRIPLAELKQNVNLGISEQTLRRRLKEDGIRK